MMIHNASTALGTYQSLFSKLYLFAYLILKTISNLQMRNQRHLAPLPELAYNRAKLKTQKSVIPESSVVTTPPNITARKELEIGMIT